VISTKRALAQRRTLIKNVKDFWHVYKKNRAAFGGLALMVFVLSLAGFAPFLTPYEPRRMVAIPFIAPVWSHPMGTDNLGRDMFTEVLYGARTSLMVSFLAAFTSAIVGVLLGAISGFYGGYIDEIFMRITELFQVVPRLILALATVAIVGPSVWNLIWVIGLTSWPTTARLLRVEFLSLRERPFVEAVKGLGAGDIQVAFREILPNATYCIIVNVSFEVARAIITESSLTFLGLGDANIPSLGILLQNAQPYLQTAWWMSVFPGTLIVLAVLSLNLVGDGLNEALSPKLRER